jgi:putative membrane protein
MRWILHWIVSAASLAVVAFVVPGIHVASVTTLFIVALVLGVVNATLGLLLKVVTFPLMVLTFGIFWFVINALMIELVAHMVKGFYVSGFGAAFIGAIVMAIVNTIMKWLMPKEERS